MHRLFSAKLETTPKLDHSTVLAVVVPLFGAGSLLLCSLGKLVAGFV